MAWLIRMAGLRDLRRDDGLSDVSATVLGDGMSDLTLEYQLKQLNERHMEYAAGLHAKIEKLEQQLEAAKKSAMRANAKYVNATWSESERNKAASDDYMSLVALYEKEVALSDMFAKALLDGRGKTVDEMKALGKWRKVRGL